jgi:hypothetical protein
MPRPLYPPDASARGKKPSPAGLDVEAVKRAVSRGGRWPWQRFSTEFSNGFSHGAGPNVIDSGVAGIQRQNGIDATGWIGEATFNLLRSARIPVGLPHAGEPLFDARAIELLETYRAQKAGGATRRLQALNLAKQQLGYSESPPGTNGNMYGAWYGMNYEPWCAMFVSWCYEHAGGSPSFAQNSRYAYCPYILSDAQAERNGLSVVSEPIAGDLVLYDWEGGDVDHIGLFEAWSGGRTFQAIEGNTSTSNNSNGGQVMRRQRDAGGTADVIFVRVHE